MCDHDEESLANDDCPKFNPPLYIQRYQTVCNLIKKENATLTKVADLGCAEGRFLRYLKAIPFLEEISAVDIDRYNVQESEYFAKPLLWDHTFGRYVALKINLYEGDVTKPDHRLDGYDVVTCIELIEHLHPETLERLPQNIFGYIRPRVVIVTTPNKDFNVLFTQLKATEFRHWDHKFEWTRAEFAYWCRKICSSYTDYEFELQGVGTPPPGREDVGCCSQVAIFRRITPKEPEPQRNDVNYNLIESYYYKERDKTKKSEESFTTIDWDAILKR